MITSSLREKHSVVIQFAFIFTQNLSYTFKMFGYLNVQNVRQVKSSELIEFKFSKLNS